MRKRVGIFLALLVLSLIIIVYAQSFDSGKMILNNDANSIGRLVSSENLNIGDIFYLDDGRKAKVTGIEEIVDSDSSFNNQNFFANGVLVHNKDGKTLGEVFVPREVTGSSLDQIVVDESRIPSSLPRAKGSYKDVIFINPKNMDNLPPNIQAEVRRVLLENNLPDNTELVIKILNEDDNLFVGLHDSLEYMERYQREATLPGKMRPMLDEAIGYEGVATPVYSYGFKRIQLKDGFRIQGFIIQKRVRGFSTNALNDFAERLDGLDYNPAVSRRIREVKKVVNDELDRVYPLYESAAKKSKIMILDLDTGENIIIEVRCGKKSLTLNEVFNPDGPKLNQLEIRIHTPDLGENFPEGISLFGRTYESGGIGPFDKITYEPSP